jgi:hypothetical protein
MKLEIATLGLAVLATLGVAARPSVAATCFCQVTAGGNEVDKPNKGDFIQGVQTEACKNYCRGVWDSKSGPDLAAWAKLSGRCGDIDLKMAAAIGTAKASGIPAIPGRRSHTRCS